MITQQQKNKIVESFSQGKLKVKSVSPEGKTEWKQITHVHRHQTPWESMWDITTEKGSMKLTGGHRVFTSPTEKIETEKIEVGDTLLSAHNSKVEVLKKEKIPVPEYVYDLTAEDWHNFVLHDSQAVISNSPDRNYHFRPPEHEGTIKNYNRVFGFIWEDHELLEYMNMALDFWNAAPPETESLCSLDLLMSQKPAWRAYIMWGAIAHAALALSFNWISEEFSVGGEEKVDVVLPDGKEISVTMEELYDICK